MRFRFLGGMDCPDWLLTQICSNFAKFTSLKFRALCQQAASFIIDGKIDQNALKRCEDELNNVSSLHTTVALIGQWLLKKPAGYDCSADDLQNELIQLGLPLEHSKMIHKVYIANVNRFKQIVNDSVFKEPHAELISVNLPNTVMIMKIEDKTYEISATRSQVETMSHDLRRALSEMDQIMTNSK